METIVSSCSSDDELVANFTNATLRFSDEAGLTTFLKNKKKIIANLEFIGLEIDSIYMPELETIEGNLNISACNYLISIYAPKFAKVHVLEIRSNPFLEAIYLKNLNNISGSLYIISNNRLATTELLNMDFLKGKVQIENNRRLTVFHVKVAEASLSKFVIRQNPMMQKIIFIAKNLLWRPCGTDCPKECASVATALDVLTCANFVIKDNKILMAVDFPSPTKHDGIRHFLVHRNPLLGDADKRRLRSLAGPGPLAIDIDGYCYLEKPVKSLKEIDGCKKIMTDLVFAENATGVYWPNVDFIDGCLFMNNTHLRTLRGLYNTVYNCTKKNVVVNNFHLCDQPDWSNGAQNTTTKMESKGNCGAYCTKVEELFSENMYKNCYGFIGDLKIKGLKIENEIVKDKENRTFGDRETFTKMAKKIGKRLKWVWGQLHLEGNEIEEFMWIFFGLQNIYNIGNQTDDRKEEFSLKLADNRLLSSNVFLFKSLLAIYGEGDQIKVYVAGNRPKAQQQYLADRISKRVIYPTIYSIEAGFSVSGIQGSEHKKRIRQNDTMTTNRTEGNATAAPIVKRSVDENEFSEEEYGNNEDEVIEIRKDEWIRDKPSEEEKGEFTGILHSVMKILAPVVFGTIILGTVFLYAIGGEHLIGL